MPDPLTLTGLTDEISSAYSALIALHRAVARLRGHDTEGSAHLRQAEILDQDAIFWRARLKVAPAPYRCTDLPDPRAGYGVSA
jgi:hypothetical protein